MCVCVCVYIFLEGSRQLVSFYGTDEGTYSSSYRFSLMSIKFP